MASDVSSVDLQEVRGLAHKLYGQCRNSSSAYKLLTSSVRKIRNRVEEIEEVIDDQLQAHNHHNLLEQVSKGQELLLQLDASLQSYAISNSNEVDESAVADIKTALDVIEHELSLASKDILSSGIDLSTAKNSASVQPSSTYLRSQSSSDGTGALDRLSGRTSSAWTPSSRDSASNDSVNDGAGPFPPTASKVYASEEKEVVRHAREEKEVSDIGNSRLRSTSEATISPDWRSPFASLDPLSMSFEQASFMIMSSDDDVGDGALTRRPSQSDAQDPITEVGETTVKQSGEESSSTHESTVDQDTATDNDAITRSDAAATQDSANIDAQESTIEESTLVDHLSHNVAAQSHPRSQSDVLAQIHLSPRQAEEVSHRRRSYSVPSMASAVQSLEAEQVVETRSESFHVEPAESRSLEPSNAVTDDHSPQQAGEYTVATHYHMPGTSAGNAMVERNPNLVEELSTIMESAFHESDEAEVTAPPMPLSNAISASLPVSAASTVGPTPPDRAPPEPPKRRRRPKPSPTSSAYRIVNASGSDGSEPESEEDLYSSSRPSSPTASSRTAPMQFGSRLSGEPNAFEQFTRAATVAGPRRLSRRDYMHRVLSTRAAYDPNDNTSSIAEDSKSISASNNGTEVSEDASARGVSESGSIPAIHIHPTASMRSAASSEQLDSIMNARSVSMQAATGTALVTGRAYPGEPQGQGNYDGGSRAHTRASSHTESTPPSEKFLDTGIEDKSSDGIEVNNTLKLEPQAVRLPPQIHINSPLHVRNSSASTQVSLQDGNFEQRTSTAFVSPQISAKVSFSPPEPPQQRPLDGWYAPAKSEQSALHLESEQLDRIVYFWNECLWDQAEAALMTYLQTLLTYSAPLQLRRVHHLLGVCASFQGDWNRATTFFISVLKSPLSDLSYLDDGDCSAAYWLGDAYALRNQRLDAFLAYRIAGRGRVFNTSAGAALLSCIRAEQEAARLGASRAALMDRLERETSQYTADNAQALLNTNIMSYRTAQALVNTNPDLPTDPTLRFDQTTPRTSSLYNIDPSESWKHHHMKLTRAHFDPSGPWPMLYDPLFSMPNVLRGRLLAHECDMYRVFTENPNARVPRSGPVGLSRMECFTFPDLIWLIMTLRDCLRTLEMEWSEIANVDGTWMVVRYPFIQHRIATIYYFSIALFRQSLRSGYGAEICPDGICSARIIRSDSEHSKGVHQSEAKRVRKLIRDYLEQAARQRQKMGKKSNAFARVSSSSDSLPRASLSSASIPPPPTIRTQRYG